MYICLGKFLLGAMPKKKIIQHDEPVHARPHRNMVSINLLNCVALLSTDFFITESQSGIRSI